MKTCKKCKVEKEFSDFSKQKKGKNGYRSNCKKCISQSSKKYSKQYHLDNKVNLNKKNKDYRLNNKEKVKEYNKEYRLNNKEKSKEYNLNNKDKNNERQKNRKLNEPLFKLIVNTRSLIGSSIRNNGYSKKSKTYEILGCSFEQFKAHLESQFTEGMTWSIYGQWHLDHIYPVSRAIDEEHLIKLNHYTNFQPLWAEDNIKKGNKI